MAKQNFLSGGFYGKLGAMVGQRWKNKRTIRTYVIPKNPNTPEQKRNRNNFAGAVQFAQMGMQMNYYCNLFENPNFTKWNYRMSVARNLKFAGMTDLNLIPLYPTDFTPPTTITKIKVNSTTGNNHITFSVPELTAVEDRVFSMMFALYNNQSIFLGYKLYLGYYDKDYPQLLEVNVDDVKEINSKCFVRIVTNDDVDSKTDMIASSKIKVETDGKDEHDFNCNVSLIEKSQDGLKITFAEPWQENPTVNTISFKLSFVTAGAWQTVQIDGGVLENNNGLCAFNIMYPTTYNQDLPAFPVGSSITDVNVRYEGASYRITLTNGSAQYSDADLVRNLDRHFEHYDVDEVKVSIAVLFSGTVQEQSVQMDYCTEGRFGDSSILNGIFSVSANDGYLNIRATGTDRNYPMKEENSYIDIPEMNVVSEGVTYRKQAEKKYFSNGVTVSSYLIDNPKPMYFYKAKEEGTDNFTQLYVDIQELPGNADAPGDCTFIEKIVNADGSEVRVTEAWAENFGTAGDFDITYYNFFQDDPNYAKVDNNSTVVFKGSTNGNVFVPYNGIYYDTGASKPKVSNWSYQ